MQRARCCAANAYDATSAFRAIFGRTPTLHRLRRPSEICKEAFSGNLRRSYSTTKDDARQEKLAASAVSKPTTSNSLDRKLAFYEELMANETALQRESRPRTEPKKQDNIQAEDQVEDERPWDARPGLSLHGEPLWKNRMIALSQHIRESRLAKKQETPENEDDPKRPLTLDYQGIAIKPEKSNVYPRQRPPWATVFNRETANHTAAQVLDAEIVAFAEYMLPTEEEQIARDAVRKHFRAIMRDDPDHRAVYNYHFGSTKTGLTMPFSDIDLGVYHSKIHRDNLEEYMERLYQKLLSEKDYMLVVHRPPPNAIITAQHRVTGIDVQVIAKGSPGKQDRFTERFLKTIPNFRELYAVVRTALGTRGLVNPFIGGISAYGTSIMLVAALTHDTTPPNIHNSISAQLLHFLSFWANFDMTKNGISFPDSAKATTFAKTPAEVSSADTERRVERQEHARQRKEFMLAGQYRIGRVRPNQPYLMCLQDPSTPINDLGARCHAIKHIQESIKVMQQELVHEMAEYDRAGPNRTKLRDGSRRESFLIPLVGRSHEIYAERRKRMASHRLETGPRIRTYRSVKGTTPKNILEKLQSQDTPRSALNKKSKNRP